MDAQADLGIRCMHMPEDTFANGETQFSTFAYDLMHQQFNSIYSILKIE